MKLYCIDDTDQRVHWADPTDTNAAGNWRLYEQRKRDGELGPLNAAGYVRPVRLRQHIKTMEASADDISRANLLGGSLVSRAEFWMDFAKRREAQDDG